MSLYAELVESHPSFSPKNHGIHCPEEWADIVRDFLDEWSHIREAPKILAIKERHGQMFVYFSYSPSNEGEAVYQRAIERSRLT